MSEFSNKILMEDREPETEGDEPRIDKIQRHIGDLSDDEIIKVMRFLCQEMQRREKQAEDELAQKRRKLKTLTDVVLKVNDVHEKPVSVQSGSKKTNPKKTVSKTAGGHAMLICAFLSSGPKKRSEIVNELIKSNLSTRSLGVILNRLKKEGKIEQHSKGSPYSLVNQ